MVASVSANGSGAVLEEKPYRWSQRWFDDPPVGTAVTLGDGRAEVYVGRGEWVVAPISDVWHLREDG